MPHYIGRFAPSPTGPLHIGSLLAALVSYLDAKANEGEWLVRIEDIDPPREMSDASTDILRTLESHGLEWDKEVRFQSKYSSHYEKLLNTLEQSSLCYRCPCSRKQLHDNGGQHLSSCGITGRQSSQEQNAIRFRSKGLSICWRDLLLGSQSRDIGEDFVLKRRDGLYSYQLAVVRDDIDQGITHVIRGADLIDSTPMQIALYQSLKSDPPNFGHFPLVVSRETGQKLSKQNLATPVNNTKPIANLNLLACFLGLSIPEDSTVQNALNAMTKQWCRQKLDRQENFKI